MQDTINKTHNSYPRSIHVGSKELLKRQIIDEEMTHAAEIVAAVSGGADIPRVYFEQNGDLIDPYGVSLSSVLEKGIFHLENSEVKTPGWQWELKRRKIERLNLQKIISAPEGVACIEISPTDLTKPKSELLEYGYTGDSLVRISYKHSGQVFQRNIILQTSDIKILNALRVKLDKGASDIRNADEALADMIFVSVVASSFEAFIADFKNFASNKISRKSPARYLSSIIKKAKIKQKNAWDIVSSSGSLFDDMYARIEELSLGGKCSADEVNLIRAGVWQCLIENYNNCDIDKINSIDDGIAMARSVGAVFTSCGGTISIDSKHIAGSGGYIGRYDTVKNLINKISGYGCCQSCGSSGFMYGCGVYCRSCNSTWCDAYLRTGKQLSNKEVAEKQYQSIFRLWLF